MLLCYIGIALSREAYNWDSSARSDLKALIIIIIIIAKMAVFDVAGYLVEERRRWPVITASPRGQYSK